MPISMQLPLKLSTRFRRKASVAAPRSMAMKAKPKTKWVLPLVMVALAILCGMIMALGAVQYAILVVALICAPVVMLMPSTGLISLLLVVSTVVAGSLEYFGRVHQAHWIPALIMAAMLARIPLDAFKASLAAKPGSSGPSALALLLWIFVVVFVISGLVNLSPPMQVLVGVKQYIFPLALVAAVAQAGAARRYWLKIWRWIPWLVVIQLPLCLYQYIFVEKGSAAKFGAAGISWDAVVGSFGGNPEGGGASGALAIFLCFGFVTTLALRRTKQISSLLAWVAAGSALISIFIAEVKVVVVFLPIVMLIYHRAKIKKSAVSAIAWVMGAVVFVVAVLFAYDTLHYSGGSSKAFSLLDTFQFSTRAEQDVDLFNKQTGELSRTGALKVWVTHAIKYGSAQESILGYGPAASKSYSSLFGQGEIARKLPYQLQTSTASALLWDLGLMGFVSYLLVFALGFYKALGLAKAMNRDAPLVVIAETSAIALFLTGAGLFYNNSSLSVASVQLLASLAFGMILILPRLFSEGALLLPGDSVLKERLKFGRS